MKYPKAEYVKLSKCPDCGMLERQSDDNMPEKDGFRYNTDDKGIDYTECSCGCKFVEE